MFPYDNFVRKNLLEDDRTIKVNSQPGIDHCSFQSSAKDIHPYYLDVPFHRTLGSFELGTHSCID